MPRDVVSAANQREDTLVAAGVCGYGGCDTPAMDRDSVSVHNVPPGLCKFHTLAAIMESRRHNWPTRDGAYRDAEPYITWVRTVLDSGIITYQGLSLANVDRHTLAILVGIHPDTVTNLRKGEYKKLKVRTARLLDPYITLTTPTGTVNGLQTGDRVERGELFRLPKGSVVLDNYRRAWQCRDGRTKHSAPAWYPAHGLTVLESPETTHQYPALDHGPRLPATVLWIPGKPVKALKR